MRAFEVLEACRLRGVDAATESVAMLAHAGAAEGVRCAAGGGAAGTSIGIAPDGAVPPDGAVTRTARGGAPRWRARFEVSLPLDAASDGDSAPTFLAVFAGGATLGTARIAESRAELCTAWPARGVVSVPLGDAAGHVDLRVSVSDFSPLAALKVAGFDQLGFGGVS